MVTISSPAPSSTGSWDGGPSAGFTSSIPPPSAPAVTCCFIATIPLALGPGEIGLAALPAIVALASSDDSYPDARAPRRAAVAMAARSAEPALLLAQAEHDAVCLERQERPWALAYAPFLQGAIACRRGQHSTARQRLEDAANLFLSCDMELCAAVMRWQLGKLAGGPRRHVAQGPRRCFHERARDLRPRPLGKHVRPGLLGGRDVRHGDSARSLLRRSTSASVSPPARPLQERARNKFAICGPAMSEGFFWLTPEGSRSVARGILPLEGSRRPPLPTSALDGAWRKGMSGPWSRGGKAAPGYEPAPPPGADAGQHRIQTGKLFPSRSSRGSSV